MNIVAYTLARPGKILYGTCTVRSLPRPRCFSVSTNDGYATLVLIRHGQSTWNATPTFTGWCDAPLTSRGIAEAKASGQLLKERNLSQFDMAFTSTLQRAIVTCQLVLGNASSNNSPNTSPSSTGPIQLAWQLNERHYGALQGFRKDDPNIKQKYGKELLRSWRRDFHATPPPMDQSHPHYQPPPAPLTESLADCQTRVLKYWHDTIMPSLQRKPKSKVLLVAHSNTLRALVSYLDDVPIEKVPHIHIPNSVPCVYHIDPCSEEKGRGPGRVISPLVESAAGGTRGQWMFSSENYQRLRGKIGGTGSFVRSIFEAWDLNQDGVLSREEMEIGLGGIVGDEDVAVSALAGKMLEEMDEDRSGTIDLDEFEAYARVACEKHFPGFLGNADS